MEMGSRKSLLTRKINAYYRGRFHLKLEGEGNV